VTSTVSTAGRPQATPLPAYAPAFGIWVFRIAVAYFLLLKIVFSVSVPPNGDEAYYWLWGQHLQWSYLDHSPMTGWANWLGTFLGWNLFAMRFASLLTFAGTAAMVWVWAGRLAPPALREHYFWACLALYLASPLMNALSTLIYPDHLLIFFAIVTLHFFALFLADRAEGKPGRLRHLYLGALFLGIAGMSKYNAVFLAAGFASVLVLDRRFWPLWRSPHLYLAGLLTVAIVSPVFIWNWANGFPTLKLHTLQRFSDRVDFRFDGVSRVLYMSALYFSPFLLWGLLRFLTRGGLTGVLEQLRAVGRTTFVISTVFMLGLATWSAASSQVAPHWNVLSLVAFLIAAPLFVRSRWLVGLHLAFGALGITAAVAYYVLSPLATDALNIRDREAVITYGQEQVADAARAAKERLGADFYATVTYTTASKFAFGLGTDAGIVTLTHNIDQFDFWRNPDDFAGKDAIIVIERGSTDSFSSFFDSFEEIGPVDTTRYGRPLATYRLYLGRGYKPSDVRVQGWTGR
jgi:4-amino-4-deoxy-L-arabinose transferase-like glycosyltransferase